MLSRGLTLFTDTPITVMGLIIFLSVFCGICYWTLFRKRTAEFYQKLGELPFNEDCHERE